MKIHKKQLRIGFEVLENGIVRQRCFQDQDFTRSYRPVPVIWKGAKAELYFWNYISRRTPLNRLASDLILHPGFDVYGRAVVVTARERWHHFRVEGTERDAKARLNHLAGGFKDQVLFFPSGRWETHQSIYVRDDDDAFAVRIALS